MADVENSTTGADPRGSMPNSWHYRRLSIFGWKIPYYASPTMQILILSFVCFL